MENQYPFTTTEEERAQRRAQRIEARRQRERERRLRFLRRAAPAAAVLAVLAGVLLFRGLDSGEVPGGAKAAMSDSPDGLVPASEPEPVQPPEPAFFSVEATADTVQLGDEIGSEFAILIDLTAGTILAQKSPDTVISPASMTKIMTLLVAAEHIEDLDATETITFDITNYCYLNDCSVAGFLKDEEVPVRDLLYGTILPSGADGALALVNHVSGSEEAFVALMNEKAEELGLSDTARFANCIGLYDEDNHCTVYDMAMILKAAMDNELCRQVLTTKVYEIPASDAHPEGMVLSNWFLRRIEDHMPEGMEILGAKTGFVVQSGNCAASSARDAAGNEYLCVTGNTYSSWACIFDHAALYGTVAAAASGQ